MSPKTFLLIAAIGLFPATRVSVRSNTTAGSAVHARSGTRAPAVDSLGVDSLAVRRDAEAKVRAFLLEWRGDWLKSDSARRRSHFYDRALAARNAHAHCHATYGSRTSDEEPYAIRENYAPIRSAARAQARCPSWILGAAGTMADEADVIDGALLPGPQDQVRESRQYLLADLDSAQRQLPGDGWLVGQRVRFLLDAGRNDDAVRAVRSCHVDAWWCAALKGYTYHQLHLDIAADSAFVAALSAMTPDARCEWTDIRQLLPHESKDETDAYAAYAASSCEERARVNERYWWMARPLFTAPVNERQVAHYARRVLLALHQGLDRDERYRWGKEYGGDAAAEMMVRYGWPSVSVHISLEEDRNHDDYLKSHGAKAASPYATAEYSADRYHFAPSTEALANPFRATDRAWELVAPVGMRTSEYSADPVWWPVEHMRYDGALMVPLPAGQVATFRRQHAVMLAQAIDVSPQDAPLLQPLEGEAVSMSLVASPSPDSMLVLAHTTSPWSGRLRLLAPFASRPVLAGVELSGGTSPRIVARTRYGVVPPPPLSALVPGAIAVSDPVFFAADASGALPGDVDALMPRMTGTTVFARGTKVGVFWESYGIPAGDSVRIAVSVTPETGPGLLRRLGAALRIVDASMTGIAVAWQDPQARAADAASRALVPILPRSVVLDLSELPKGPYQIEVVVTTPGRDAARAHRSLLLN